MAYSLGPPINSSASLCLHVNGFIAKRAKRQSHAYGVFGVNRISRDHCIWWPKRILQNETYPTENQR